jgi:hypothetical protein
MESFFLAETLKYLYLLFAPAPHYGPQGHRFQHGGSSHSKNLVTIVIAILIKLNNQ